MKKFGSNTHGAVTIIVSIMLIPALLLSGTSVDLARIHTAKSIAHNANQLAANAVLTQYNALLK
ncbi:MAG: pilus assembly protein TadG-related protein, partial [Oscillospiraceae bacterium]|nr:pilus assembly protein TadG-related protein [Oscillospiraceae bacterium]